MTNTVIFQPGLTWAKLGYALYSNSLSYRDVLDQNPKWNVTELPPPGSVIVTNDANSSTSLNQTVSPYGSSSGANSEEYYPYTSKTEYFESLMRYNTQALFDVERINGWTINSQIAVG